ncbi:hypothetical protein BGZ58_004933 [Dissophora ornata]|nr:hypothetical protein BGZ58_004933 [Dissophora ornata]
MLPSPPSSVESGIARRPFSPTSDRPPTLVRNSNLSSPAMSSIPSPASSSVSPSALSSALIFTSSSGSRRKQSDTAEILTLSQTDKTDKTDNRGRGKAHIFSIEEETYIATLLSDPNTWSLLDGALAKNSHLKPKTKVREEIAQKFNSRFSTENPVDAQQIKNKIGNMKDKWKKANALINRANNPDKEPNNKLQDGVRILCHFYHILDPVWSKSFALNSAAQMDLTTNATPPVACNAGEQESGENSENESVNTPRWNWIFNKQAQDWQDAAERTKRHRDTASTGTDLVEPVEGLESTATDEQEIKRKKVESEDDQRIELEKERLAFERKKLELKNKEAELQVLLLDMQVKKIQAEIVNERERIQLEHRRLDIEQLKLQADLENNRRHQTLRCGCSS